MKLLCKGIVPGGDASFLFGAMRKLALFASMSDEQLYKVLYCVKSVEYDAGETVFKKGDPGSSFYVVQSGKAEARVPGFLGLSKVINAMGPGDFFGELALILKQARAATIVCAVKTTCFVLERADLEALILSSPDIAAAIKKVAGQRLDGRA